MICASCNNNVHPTQRMTNVPCCVACGERVPGVERIEDQAKCAACNHIGHLVPRRMFASYCPVESCRALMPAQETVDEPSPEKPPADGEAPQPPRVVKAIVKVSPRNVPVDIISQCRERLAYCQEQIADLRKYETEAAKLERMLAAADALDLAAE